MTAKRYKPAVIMAPLAMDMDTAAVALGLGETGIRTAIEMGLPVVRVGRRMVIPVDSARQWLADRAAGIPVEAKP